MRPLQWPPPPEAAAEGGSPLRDRSGEDTDGEAPAAGGSLSCAASGYYEFHLPQLGGRFANPIGAGDTVGAAMLCALAARAKAHSAFALGLAARRCWDVWCSLMRGWRRRALRARVPVHVAVCVR